jgi:hypothetical protein
MVSCDDGAEPQANASPSASSTSPSPSPQVTRPHKPRPQAGRLEGTYKVRYTLIVSDIPDSAPIERNRWRILAACREGGSCNARVESVNNDWKASAAWRGGLYRWARNVKKAYTCGSGGNVDYNIDATYEYSIRGQKVRWDGENWVISSFRGTFVSKGLRGCGLSGPPQQRWAIIGKLQ